MAMALPVLQKYNEAEYRRWIQLWKGVYIVKDALCPHVDKGFKDFHKNVLKPAFCADCCLASTPVLDKLDKLDKQTYKWSLPLCTHGCAHWLDIIAAEHPSNRKDMFKFCDVTQLNTCPWELAKAFLPDYPKVQSTKAPAELDPYYIMKMIRTCRLFSSIHAEVEKVHETRNMLAHAMDQGFNKDDEMKAKMGSMIELMELLNLSDAAEKLKEIRDTNIIEVDVNEMEKIKTFAQEIQQLKKEVQVVGQKVEDEAQATRQKVEDEAQATRQKVEEGDDKVIAEMQATRQKMEELLKTAKQTDDSPPKESTKDDTLQRLRDELAETYLRHYSQMQPVPWSTEVNLPINLVYQEQTVTERKGASSQHNSSSDLKSTFETTGKEQSRPCRILIQGPPGIGKSTLTQRLIQSWARRVNASPTEAASQHQAASQDNLEDSRLHDFQLVFLIRVRDLIPGDLTVNLQKNLVNSCWKDKDLERLKTCIYKNIEKVLLIVDGYDEGDEAQRTWVDSCLRGADCRGCTLIVTSRPGFCRPTVQPEQNPDRTYTLMGLDRAKQQDFASKFDQVMGVASGKRSASEQLSQFHDQDFLQTPLLLALVCVLASQGEGALPKTVSALYNEFTEFLSLKAMRDPVNFKEEEVTKLIDFLKKIAFKLFKQKKSEISSELLNDFVLKSEIEKTMKDLCKFGFVQQELKLKGLKNSQTGEFIHQSFLDFFAAHHFVSVSAEERSALLKDIAIRENMLLLAAGLCGEGGEQHRECFGQMVEAWDRAVQRELEEKGWCRDHSVRHACVLWLTELRDPCWLSADHISAIYRTGVKASEGECICLSYSCITSCCRGVTTLLHAARHTLHGSRHAPCDPATFKLTVGTDDYNTISAAQLDVLDAALRCDVQLDCKRLTFSDCLTRAESDQLAAILPRLTQLRSLRLTTSSSSFTALDAVLRADNSTSTLQYLTVRCSPSSPRDSPPAAAAAAAAEDPWSPSDELLDNISRFSALRMITLRDRESTVTKENRRAIKRRISDRLPGVEVVIY